MRVEDYKITFIFVAFALDAQNSHKQGYNHY
jgi:hypothetical protein